MDQGRLVPEEVRECCSKLLITLVIQTHGGPGLVGYGSCVEKQLLEFNEHQLKVLYERVNFHSLKNKLNLLCELYKFESSFATLSWQVQ